MHKAALSFRLFLLVLLAGCTGDLGLNDFKGACEKDSDCLKGYRCDRQAGCVALAGADGGVQPDGARDAGRPDAGDAGPGDGGDAGTGDTGPIDTGPPGDGGIILQYSTTYDSAAGAGVSTGNDLMLKSSTGWSPAPRSGNGSATLQPGQPWGRK